MSHSSATLGLPNLPLELRTQIYTVASSDDLIVYKNNSTGVFGLLSGPGFSQVSRQVRQENNESNQHLLRIGEVTKHHIEIDLDLFDVENSEGSSWMALFDFPREATTLTVNVNIKTPHYSFASFSSSNDGYEAIVERLTTALSDCVNLTTCAVTLNILEPEPWFLFHQQPDFLDYLDWNWLLWVDCAPVILMIKSKSLSVPNDPKDFRPDASISSILDLCASTTRICIPHWSGASHLANEKRSLCFALSRSTGSTWARPIQMRVSGDSVHNDSNSSTIMRMRVILQEVAYAAVLLVH